MEEVALNVERRVDVDVVRAAREESVPCREEMCERRE